MSAILRVGEIPYLNMFPIFTALRNYFDNREVKFVSGHPNELNRKLRENSVDISPSSSIEYARNPHRYYLVPDISISSREKVKSVLLFSPFKIEESSDFSVFASSSSETSVTLLKIVIQEFLGKKAHVVMTDSPREEASKEFAPYLLIGDEAIRESLGETGQKSRYLYDLGSVWRENTGLPFVFALWIVNERSYFRKKKAIKKFARKLLDAKKISLNLIRFRNEKMLAKDNYPWDFLNEYWTNLSYDLDIELDGLLKFFELSLKIGDIEHFPEIRFIDLF